MQPLALTGTYRLAAAVVFGVLLGFVLVRSQLSWKKTITDQFSMKNSQFFKTLFSAVAFGIIFFYLAKKYGIVHHNIRPTFFWGAALGGMISAAGLVFCGQFPSTAVAALASGRFYALWVFAGMLLALPFVRIFSKMISETINTYNWPVPASYERIDQFFTGSNILFWLAFFSALLCLFFEFIQTDDKKGGAE